MIELRTHDIKLPLKCGNCAQPDGGPTVIGFGDEYYLVHLEARKLTRCAACGLKMLEEREASLNAQASNV